MVTYNEEMRMPELHIKMWKFSGTCEVSLQRNTQCCACGDTKLCWVIESANQTLYYCVECKDITDGEL